MHQGHCVFAQLMQHLPLTTFRRCVARYNGEYRIQQFSCLDQYLCLAFAQLTWRESLRDIEACLRALLDLRGSIPSFIFISDGKMHDVNILDQLVPEAGAFYVMDRGYLDFERLARLDDAGSFFVTRASQTSRLAAAIRPGRSFDRPRLRPDGSLDRLLFAPGLRPSAAADQVQRSTNQQAAGVSHQQFRPRRTHHRQALQIPLASGTVLQMDQAAPA